MGRSLRARIALGLGGYSLLLATVLIGIGYSVHESLEWLVWRSQLDAEMTDFLKSRAAHRRVDLPHTGKLRAYVVGPGDVGRAELPTALRQLGPGLHDDIEIGKFEAAVMVRDVGAERIYMLIDVSRLESEEQSIAIALIAMTLLGSGVLVLVVWWLSGRLVQPVSELTREIDRLQPSISPKHALTVAADAPSEVRSIATAMNRLIGRMDELIEREREFVNTVSHELRTPLAVIQGAAQVAVEQPDLPDQVLAPLQRIRHCSQEVEQLIYLLLVLAKSPSRLTESAEAFGLDELLPVILDDHRHLVGDKPLQLVLGPISPGRLRAPLAIVQIAIANLLRNAIENSDRGRIEVSVQPAGVVRMQDDGIGMGPEEISRIYATLARSGARSAGQGIGLALIARICNHLSWQLEAQSGGDGSLVVLDLRSSLIPSDAAQSG